MNRFTDLILDLRLQTIQEVVAIIVDLGAKVIRVI